MLLTRFESWAPFRVDALGIVTILGADQMDLVLGRLAHTGFSTFLPLLGAYKAADNSIVKPIPGFTLYNVSDGVLATDINGWFARWLLCQDLTFTSTTLIMSILCQSKTIPLLQDPGLTGCSSISLASWRCVHC